MYLYKTIDNVISDKVDKFVKYIDANLEEQITILLHQYGTVIFHHWVRMFILRCQEQWTTLFRHFV